MLIGSLTVYHFVPALIQQKTWAKKYLHLFVMSEQYYEGCLKTSASFKALVPSDH